MKKWYVNENCEVYTTRKEAQACGDYWTCETDQDLPVDMPEEVRQCMYYRFLDSRIRPWFSGKTVRISFRVSVFFPTCPITGYAAGTVFVHGCPNKAWRPFLGQKITVPETSLLWFCFEDIYRYRESNWVDDETVSMGIPAMETLSVLSDTHEMKVIFRDKEDKERVFEFYCNKKGE
jgi:hypothetical protein